ncbi:phosphoglycerate dehydrogenase [Pseudalkalibacillus berkeleyi]|uniref:D-3-phosphoglycerate dehydrogenase n=1 Tax=Pseudalkalibacillus berkeleyi TaxID=1069813 RepID=A0ABS9H142_9BACL|nr:phosphoglycerate dehydrogenase [Pseudalkalibacillus berkeleyi]MCF6137616.1 phosphoglycerate dehydrogenase [Pseudalkalibacillus berkeleyi]
MYNIVISDPISRTGLEPLLNTSGIHLIEKNIHDVDHKNDIDAIIVRSGTKITEDLINDMSRLKIIARAGVGVDNIDVDAATERGIIVVNAPNGNTISTAEHTFAMMLSLMRNIPQANRSIRNLEWKRSKFTGHELHGKTLGIIGMGKIGTELAKRALAFEMNIHVYDPYLTQERAKKLQVSTLPLQSVLENADIITVHTPLNDDTRSLINKETIELMKKGVYLINCARGGIIDEEDLLQSLDSGHVAGAALDVFTEEPCQNKALLQHEHVIATPHIAASTTEAQFHVAKQVSEDVRNVLLGEPSLNSLNYPTISKDLHEFIYPYIDLASRLGAFLSECIKTPVNEIQLSYSGDLSDHETLPITRSLLAGFLNPRVDQNVNIINASVVAKQRGISYGETKASQTYGYSNLIEVTVLGEHHSVSIKGTLIPGLGGRVVNLNGFDIDFTPKGNLVFITHNDQPGVIGKVGNVLGKYDVNIATMQVGRKEVGGGAAMVLSFDQPLTGTMLEELQETNNIASVTAMSMD